MACNVNIKYIVKIFSLKEFVVSTIINNNSSLNMRFVVN